MNQADSVCVPTQPSWKIVGCRKAEHPSAPKEPPQCLREPKGSAWCSRSRYGSYALQKRPSSRQEPPATDRMPCDSGVCAVTFRSISSFHRPYNSSTLELYGDCVYNIITYIGFFQPIHFIFFRPRCIIRPASTSMRRGRLKILIIWRYIG